MTEYVGPSLSNYLLVLGFLALLFVGLYYIKKNKHIISRTINSKKRMKVSEVTLLGQGDRALILNLDNKDYNRSNKNKILKEKISELPVLENDTSNVIEFNNSLESEIKSDKKRSFWDLLKNKWEEKR